MATLKQRVHRYNGSSYDTVHYETQADLVTYTNNNQSNVKGALDDLYTKVPSGSGYEGRGYTLLYQNTVTLNSSIYRDTTFTPTSYNLLQYDTLIFDMSTIYNVTTNTTNTFGPMCVICSDDMSLVETVSSTVGGSINTTYTYNNLVSIYTWSSSSVYAYSGVMGVYKQFIKSYYTNNTMVNLYCAYSDNKLYWYNRYDKPVNNMLYQFAGATGYTATITLKMYAK